MADPFDIEMDGLNEFINGLEGADSELLQNLEKAMEDYSLLVETGSRALAPRFEGELEERLVAAAVAVRNGMVIGSVGSNLVYAWRRHEEPYRSGTHDMYHRGVLFKDYYKDGLGERSRNKTAWRGQLPGRKFLERAVVATEEDFDELMGEALAKTLEGLE